jgi:hypothetical protein
VVLVRDHSAAIALAQADGKPHPVVRSRSNSAGVPQRSRASANAASAPAVTPSASMSNTAPCACHSKKPGQVAVGVNATDALLGRWDVEHDDVIRVVGEHRGQVTHVDGRGPALDQVADLLFVAHACPLVDGCH